MIEKIRDLWRKHFIAIDTLIAFIIFWIYLLLWWQFTLVDSFDELSVWLTYVWLTWFFLAVLALIFSFKDWERFKRIQASEHFKDVIDVYVNVIGRCWIMFLFILSFSFEGIANNQYYNISNAILLSVIIIGIKSFRCVWMLRKIFILTIK